ncbi:hypothetical protein DYB37_010969, partial [Aphanomyces astaci]
LDYKLYKHLLSRGITAKVYAYPIILSFFACIPPLSELLHIWDVVSQNLDFCADLPNPWIDFRSEFCV